MRPGHVRRGRRPWAIVAVILAAAVVAAAAPLAMLVGGSAPLREELTVVLEANESLTLYVIDEVNTGGNLTVLGSGYVRLGIADVGYPYSLVYVNGTPARLTTLTLAVPLQMLGSPNLYNVDFIDFMTGETYVANLTLYSVSEGNYYYTYRGPSLIIIAAYSAGSGRLRSYAIYQSEGGAMLIETVQVVGYSYLGNGTTTVAVG